MKRDTLVRLLVEMAELADSPTGSGGGAILLEAAAEIEALERDLVAAKALAGHAAASADQAE